MRDGTMDRVRCSRFLTALAQFHSNRSRLIHGVQFNPDLPSPSETPSIYYTYFKLSISAGRAAVRIGPRCMGSGRIGTRGQRSNNEDVQRGHGSDPRQSRDFRALLATFQPCYQRSIMIEMLLIFQII